VGCEGDQVAQVRSGTNLTAPSRHEIVQEHTLAGSGLEFPTSAGCASPAARAEELRGFLEASPSELRLDLCIRGGGAAKQHEQNERVEVDARDSARPHRSNQTQSRARAVARRRDTASSGPSIRCSPSAPRVVIANRGNHRRFICPEAKLSHSQEDAFAI
jgi:hypothetical protein